MSLVNTVAWGMLRGQVAHWDMPLLGQWTLRADVPALSSLVAH